MRNSEKNKKVGENLRRLRDAKKYSQSVLAQAIRPPITFQQIQKYEKGVNRIPLIAAFDICLALGCTIWQLVDGVVDEKTYQ